MSQDFEFLSFDAPETDGLVEAAAPVEAVAHFDGRPGLAVVDTDQAVTDYLSGLLDREVDVASTLTELESRLGRWPAVVIMGPSCTEAADLAVVERWRRNLPNVATVLVTSELSTQLLHKALRAGVKLSLIHI